MSNSTGYNIGNPASYNTTLTGDVGTGSASFPLRSPYVSYYNDFRSISNSDNVVQVKKIKPNDYLVNDEINVASVNASGNVNGDTGQFNVIYTSQINGPLTINSNITVPNNYALRYGTTSAQLFYTSPLPLNLGVLTMAVNLTLANILQDVIYGIPTGVDITINLPNASGFVSSNSAIGDSLDMHIINQSITNRFIINPGNNGTLIGSSIVGSNSSSYFRIQITNISTPQYNVIRLS